MTDKEMAEEYAAKQNLQNVNISGIVRCKIADGFLAGLKAGRPQWHDLRKAPNDLPERMGLGSKEVYVAYKDGVTDFACYRFDKKYWERSENEELAENVIAWCEIPKFVE